MSIYEDERDAGFTVVRPDDSKQPPQPPAGDYDAGDYDAGALDSDAGSDEGSEVIDVEPPRVLSITPQNDAAGVRSDEPIVIQFSEAMDTTSLQANSLRVTRWIDGKPELLTLDSVAFGDDATTLTVRAQLSYATLDVLANDAGVAADTSSLEAHGFQVLLLANGIADVHGNQLADEAQTWFKTKRKVIERISLIEDGALYGNGSRNETGNYGWLLASDNWTETRAFMTFSIASLANVARIERAHITSYVWYMQGAPFSKLGDLHVEHVTFANKWEAAKAEAWDAAALQAVVAISANQAPSFKDPVGADGSGPVGIKDESDFVDVDVTDAVRDDHEHRSTRAARSQYRLRFPSLAAMPSSDGVRDSVRIYNDLGKSAAALLTPAAQTALAGQLGHPIEQFRRLPVLSVEYFVGD